MLTRLAPRIARLASLGLALVTCGRTAQPSPGNDLALGGAGPSQAGGSGGGAGSVRVDATCTLPEPKSGFVECNEGWTHRPVAVKCQIASGGGAAGGAGGDGSVNQRDLRRVDGPVPCGEDPEMCRQFQWGRCEGDEGSYCVSGCEVDADCGPSAICVCSGASPTGGACWKALCHTDADCPGSLCASAFGGDGGLACLTARDQCLTNADCPDTSCVWDDATQGRVCSSQP